MSEVRETVREVCAEIDENNGLCVSPLFCYNEDGGVNLTDLHDRILAAHEREMAAKDAEIARLKAALKPVMECDLGSPNQMAAWGAVREAQRVMREGGEK